MMPSCHNSLFYVPIVDVIHTLISFCLEDQLPLLLRLFSTVLVYDACFSLLLFFAIFPIKALCA